MLNPIVFWDLFRALGPFHIDRFATTFNTQLPNFNSYFAEVRSSGVDAFA